MKNIILDEVDVRGLFALEDEVEKIQSFLKERGISPENLLLTGMDGSEERIKEVLEKGIAGRESNTTFAQTIEEILECSFSGTPHVLDYASESDNPAIVVYDSTNLHVCDDENEHPFEITQGAYAPTHNATFRDAIIAIIHLKTGFK